MAARTVLGKGDRSSATVNMSSLGWVNTLIMVKLESILWLDRFIKTRTADKVFKVIFDGSKKTDKRLGDRHVRRQTMDIYWDTSRASFKKCFVYQATTHLNSIKIIGQLQQPDQEYRELVKEKLLQYNSNINLY